MRKRAPVMGLGLKSNGRKQRTRGTSHPVGKGGCYGQHCNEKGGSHNTKCRLVHAGGATGMEN